ncbi:MAG: glutaminyl-peptide cyclotransferase [Planctomycetes bacterium]|nr:glutaminyl-peptide cyclotransferase [Planctomycetota bacterium]
MDDGSSKTPPVSREPAAKPKEPQKASDTPKAPEKTKVYGFKVLETYPHDRSHYTQGLVFDKGDLLEGTGQLGVSLIGRFDLRTGEPKQRKRLENRYFGEGVAVWKDRILQLTWRASVGFIYDYETLERTGTFHYTGEGWGLTHDGTHLILSDGTSDLRFLDPETFEVVRKVRVTDRNRPIAKLNELEYIEGEIFANVWQTDQIARIDPKSGHVNSWIDLTGLLPDEDRRSPSRKAPEVLNGIAYDPVQKQLYVTGKYWPKLFRIELVEK